MAEDRLYHDPRLAQFYDFDNDAGPDDQFCLELARAAQSVLDLGCGTGRLATAIARETGAQVTGVDPAAAMLAIAAQKPGADRVRWITGDARDLDLGDRFDLVLLTGHAFQVFLDRPARAALLRTIARHLAAGGRFIFDSRNPLAEEWRTWVPETSLTRRDDPALGPLSSWNDVRFDPATAIAAYQTFYRLERTGEVIQATSRIAFPPKAEIAEAIAGAGLAVTRWMGDWHGATFSADRPEIIPLGTAA